MHFATYAVTAEVEVHFVASTISDIADRGRDGSDAVADDGSSDAGVEGA